jgi:hypothetical protein
MRCIATTARRPPLDDVAETYNTKRALSLNPQQVVDLAQYLKPL